MTLTWKAAISLMKNGYFCLSFCSREFEVCIQNIKSLSVLHLNVDTVKCVVDFMNLPALAMNFHTFIKSLCALDIIPRHRKYVAVFHVLMSC
jgi:hypothetical protein